MTKTQLPFSRYSSGHRRSRQVSSDTNIGEEHGVTGRQSLVGGAAKESSHNRPWGTLFTRSVKAEPRLYVLSNRGSLLDLAMLLFCIERTPKEER